MSLQSIIKELKARYLRMLYLQSVFIARQHTDARYWYRNSVCLSVRPWRSGIRQKKTWYIVIIFFTIRSPIILVLSASNIFMKFWRGHPCGGDKYKWGIKISRFSTNKSLSQTIQDSAIVTIEGEYVTAPKLSNGTSFNDLEWPLTQISRSRYYSTSSNSKTVQDRAIVTMADQ